MTNQRIVTYIMCIYGLCKNNLNTYSQLSWNVKAGMNLSKATGWADISLKPGYQFGVGIEHYFNSHWGIQPLLMLVSKGYKAKGDYNYPLEWNAPAEKYDVTTNRVYLELPVMLAYKINLIDQINLVLNGGGYISYGIAGKYKNKITLEDDSKVTEKNDAFSSGTERFDTGLGAGVTFEFRNKYTIGLIGEWGLKSVIGDYSKNQTYGLNIGYKF